MGAVFWQNDRLSYAHLIRKCIYDRKNKDLKTVTVYQETQTKKIFELEVNFEDRFMNLIKTL